MNEITKDDIGKVKKRIYFLRKCLPCIYVVTLIFYICAISIATYLQLNESFVLLFSILAINMLFLSQVDEKIKKIRKFS